MFTYIFVAVIFSWQVHPLSSLPLSHLRNLRDLDQLPLPLTLSNKHIQVKTSLLAWIQLIDNNYFTESVIVNEMFKFACSEIESEAICIAILHPSTCISEFEYIPLEQLDIHAILQLFRNKYSSRDKYAC